MKQKKPNGGWALLIFGILLLAVAAFTVLMNAELIFGQNVSNINKLLEQGTLESNVDSYIEIKIDAVFENFAETTHKTNGITTGKDQHYIVWLDDDSVIAVSVKNKKLVSELERIMDETWDYLDEKTDSLTQNTIEVKGKLRKMNTEMRKYYDEHLDYIGLKEAGFNIHYLQVDCTSSRTTYIIATAIMLVVAVLLLVAFAVTRRNLNNAAVSGFDVLQGDHSSYDYSYGEGGIQPAEPVYVQEPDLRDVPGAPAAEFPVTEGLEAADPKAAETLAEEAYKIVSDIDKQ